MAGLTKEQLTKIIVAGKLAVEEIKNKKSPATKLQKVLDFQKADGTLVADGLYGPNSRTALSYYLQTEDLPKVNNKFANTAVTWKKPVLDTSSATVAKPAVKPAAPVATSGKPSLGIGLKIPTLKTTTVAAKPAAKPATGTTTIKQIKPAASAIKTLPQAATANKKNIETIKQAVTKIASGADIKNVAAETMNEVLKTEAPKFGQDLDFIGDKVDAEELLANVFDKKTGNTLDKITKLLQNSEVSRLATSEHNALVKEGDFRRQVLERLDTVIKLARSKNKLAGDKRIVGLII